MGVEYNTFTGAYLSVDLNKEIKETKKINSCSNENCVNHKQIVRAKFCSECGSEVANISIEKRTTTSMSSILDRLNIKERLFSYNNNTIKNGKMNIYLPNFMGSYKDEEEFVFEVSIKNINDSVSDFMAHSDIVVLTDYFDTEDIEYEIEYGVVGYYT